MSSYDELIDVAISKQLLKIAVQQKRHLLLIGLPGTGKSMMGKVYSEMFVETSPEDLMTEAIRHQLEKRYKVISSEQIDFSSYALYLKSTSPEGDQDVLLLSEIDPKTDRHVPSNYTVKIVYDLFVLLHLTFDIVVIPDVEDEYLNKLLDVLIPCRRVTPEQFMEMRT